MFEGSREDAAAARARWLAEVAAALDQARSLLIELGASSGTTPERIELYVRIETARLEVQALRLGRMIRAADEPDPKRTESLWRRGELGRR